MPPWRIGMCGTFDVENLGDLLFPLIARKELSRRLGEVELHAFSYFAKSPPEWPYAVHAVADLPDAIETLDALIIGGGDLIRFDKNVARGYLSPSANIHHPTGYWLAPILMAAAQANCPVVWNAVGVIASENLAWADAMLRAAIEVSDYVAVRDEFSRQAVSSLAGTRDVIVVPDTAFGVAQLVGDGGPSDAFAKLTTEIGLIEPYIVLQASTGLEVIARLVTSHPDRFRGYRFVALPIGPIHGDNDALLRENLPGVVCLDRWPPPVLALEIIKRAEATIGRSLHLGIASLAFGTPHFRPADGLFNKYRVLSDFSGVIPYDANADLDPAWLIGKLGRRDIEPAVTARLTELTNHWDRIASIVRARTPGEGARKSFAGFLARLPVQLDAQAEALSAKAAALLDQTEALAALTEQANAAIAARDEAIAAQELAIRVMANSRSWRLTAPLRAIERRFSNDLIGSPPILNMKALENATLATQPYNWAFSDGLFAPHDARALVRSYPSDKYKTVKGFDGEKGYEYEARALIDLGHSTITHPVGLSDAWRRLANDLLSPAYRRGMTKLTARDLMTAPMEAYVCHFGRGAWLGPHVDLKDKIITHVFYFNSSWKKEDGGYLSILHSSDPSDIHAEVLPIVGNSSLIVRSQDSWHSVSKVAEGCGRSRRSMNVIFYHPGAMSTMWPPGGAAPLHDYRPDEEEEEKTGLWSKIRSRFLDRTGRHA